MRSEIAKHLDHDPHFEWRGQNVTRLENLSDIVFALALGMLLLTDTPPSTYSELIAFLTNIVPVAAGLRNLVRNLERALYIFSALWPGRRKGRLPQQFDPVACPVRGLSAALHFRQSFRLCDFPAHEDATRLMASEMDIETSAQGVAIFNAGFAMIIYLTA